MGNHSDNQTVMVLGCGPAGLAAGYKLSRNGQNVICFEKDDIVGGISKTIYHNGLRIILGTSILYQDIEGR